jgi:hypothetical protein
MFDQKELRKIFGPKREKVTGNWRKLHSKELQDWYSSLNIIRMIKLGGMCWAVYVARIVENINAYTFLFRI